MFAFILASEQLGVVEFIYLDRYLSPGDGVEEVNLQRKPELPMPIWFILDAFMMLPWL